MIIGIDFGSSITKFIILKDNKIIHKSHIKNGEDYLTHLQALDLKDISKIMICGGGASFIKEDILGITTEHVEEFKALARGGHFLSGLDECIVAGLGTGTSYLYVNKETEQHLGGSGIGGGLLATMAKNYLGYTNIDAFLDLANAGDLSKSELQIRDISQVDIGSLYAEATVANMAKLNDNSKPRDYATGIANLVFQNVGVMAYLADGAYHTGQTVVLGTLADCDVARRYFGMVSDLFKLNFIIPEDAAYGCAIGAALSGI